LHRSVIADSSQITKTNLYKLFMRRPNGKIWIQYDGTNRPVADELLEAGVPQEDIVLAWHPAELRHHTGFATG